MVKRQTEQWEKKWRIYSENKQMIWKWLCVFACLYLDNSWYTAGWVEKKMEKPHGRDPLWASVSFCLHWCVVVGAVLLSSSQPACIIIVVPLWLCLNPFFSLSLLAFSLCKWTGEQKKVVSTGQRVVASSMVPTKCVLFCMWLLTQLNGCFSSSNGLDKVSFCDISIFTSFFFVLSYIHFVNRLWCSH